MAPLLGRRPFPLVKPLSEPPGPGEDVYIIEHTKEAFKNKEYPLWLSLPSTYTVHIQEQFRLLASIRFLHADLVFVGICVLMPFYYCFPHTLDLIVTLNVDNDVLVI